MLNAVQLGPNNGIDFITNMNSSILNLL